MVKIVSGGGINSNKVVTSKSAKAEPIAKKANPAGAAQLGAAVQFKKPALEAGKGYSPKPMGSTGIANAQKGHDGVGPGGGSRTIYAKGSQSPTPEPREMPEGRNTLSEFGPEKRGR